MDRQTDRWTGLGLGLGREELKDERTGRETDRQIYR